MNSHLIEYNKRVYKALGVSKWHEAGITGEGIKVAVIGYGACIPEHKPYITNMPNVLAGSYHDGDEIIHDIAPGAKIYGLNYLDSNRWKFEECLQWCLDNQIDVICTSIRKLSWNDEEKRLSKKLWESDCIMIDSSDNTGDTKSRYPAIDPHWFSIGAFDERSNDRYVYSSYGEHLDCVMYTNLAVQRAYQNWIPISHTSGATQPVAGIAALLKQAYDITPKQFKEYIEKNSIRLNSLSWEPHTGWGLFILGEVEEIKRTHIIIHHTGAWEKDAQQVKDYHVNIRGYRDIGYNFVIEYDGKIVPGRPLSIAGAHTEADRMNTRAIGIALLGNFEEKPPTVEQMQALKILVNTLMQEHDILTENILGHGEVNGANTRCPGKYLDMNKLRKELDGEMENKKDYKDHWAKTSIQKAIDKKIISGYPDGTWKPENPVTRAQLAVILDRLGLLD